MMAADALEEKILKIRQQNEEIRRRHEEVEADKKNAAQLNALVQLSPSTDWPERKEPPEFLSPPTVKSQSKPRIREHTEQNNQYRPVGAGGIGIGSGNGNKKTYSYPQGEGPPPDPKYNFLADVEREEQRHSDNNKNDNIKNRGKNNKINRNSFRKKNNDKKELHGRDYNEHCDNTLDESHPDYDAWRIERKKIDEARINRQITAEGNWRREWDNDKMYMIDDVSKKENNRFNLSCDNGKQQNDHNDCDRFYTRGQYSKNRDYEHDKKVSFKDDKNNKTIIDHNDKTLKNSVTSVRMSAANVAGTGRVGPRQRTRMMYSSQSGESPSPSSSSSSSTTFEISTFNRQSSLDDKQNYSQNNTTKSPHTQRKKDTEKSLFLSKKDDKFNKYDSKSHKSSYSGKNDFKNFDKSVHTTRQGNNQNYTVKSSTSQRNNSLKFTNKKNDIKIDYENVKSIVNTDDDTPIKKHVEITNNNVEDKKIQNNQDEAYYNLNDSKEYSNDFEINYFENSIHDDNEYVETTCDNSGNVKMTEQSVDDYEKTKEHSVKENLFIIKDETVDQQILDLQNDSFVDEKIKEQINIEKLNNVSSTSDEYVLDKHEEIEKDITENKDIHVVNETNINELINENVEDVFEVKNEQEESLIDEKILVKEEQLELKLEIPNNNKTSVLTNENVEDVKNGKEESLVVEETLVKEDQQVEFKIEIQDDNKTNTLITENIKDATEIKNNKEESVVEKIIIAEDQQPDTKLFISKDESQVKLLPNDSSITEIIDQHSLNQCVLKDESTLPVKEEIKNHENISKQKDNLEENTNDENSIIDNKLPENCHEKLNNIEIIDVPIVTDKDQSTSSDKINNNIVKNTTDKVLDSTDSNNE